MASKWDDQYTNEWAAMWDRDFVAELAEKMGSEKEARSFIGMMYKRVGAKKAYPALKAALNAKEDPRGYAIRSVG